MLIGLGPAVLPTATTICWRPWTTVPDGGSCTACPWGTTRDGGLPARRSRTSSPGKPVGSPRANTWKGGAITRRHQFRLPTPPRRCGRLPTHGSLADESGSGRPRCAPGDRRSHPAVGQRAPDDQLGGLPVVAGQRDATPHVPAGGRRFGDRYGRPDAVAARWPVAAADRATAPQLGRRPTRDRRQTNSGTCKCAMTTSNSRTSIMLTPAADVPSDGNIPTSPWSPAIAS